MEVVCLEKKYSEPIVLCLGFFDCMHTGHVKLIQTAQKMAQNAKLALFTFSNNHFEALKRPSKLIYTFCERLDIYRSLKVDAVVCAKFDEEFMSQKGEAFLSGITANFNLKGVVCGEDFTCGSDLLNAQGVKNFFANVCPVSVVELVKTAFDNRKICSSYIRRLLLENEIEQANGFLSQPFFFCGEVEHGRKVGESLGFPTANVSVPQEKIAPTGVYLGMAEVDGSVYKAIVNVGNTPTFHFEESKVEAHLLDFNGNLYGKKIKISLLKFLRPIQKFSGAEELKKQLQRDISRWEQEGGE